MTNELAACIEVEARQWLGTPFVAGAAVRGAGCDCGGLLVGVLRGVGVTLTRAATLQEAIILNAQLLTPTSPEAGAIITLSRAPGGRPVHIALQTSTNTLIHAHWSQGVVESHFGRWFADRVVAAYIIKGTCAWQP
jgi:cell wall-associated NlpC family hydrolase